MKRLLPLMVTFLALSMKLQAQTTSLPAPLTCPPADDMGVNPALPQCYVLSNSAEATVPPIGLVTPVIDFDRRCPFGLFCLVSGPVQFKLSSIDEMGELSPVATLGMGDGTSQKFTDMAQTYQIELKEVSPNVLGNPSYTLQYKVIVTDLKAASDMDMGPLCQFLHKNKTVGGNGGAVNFRSAKGLTKSCDENDDWKTSCKDGDGKTDEVGCLMATDQKQPGMCQYKHKKDTKGGKKGETNGKDASNKQKSCDKSGDWKTSCKDGNGDTDEVACK